MKQTKLIPILNIVVNLRKRRVIHWDEIEGWHRYYFKTGVFPSNVLAWINMYTTGRFFQDSIMVAFEDEKDYMIFKLGYHEEII